MSIREKLNEHPGITSGVVIGVLVCLAVVIVWQIRSSNAELIGKAFYTDDDGATWFADRMDRIPPFDHNGKQAVRCYVYACQKSGKQFVGYMEKFSDKTKAEYERAKTQGEAPAPTEGSLYKKPGGGAWVSGSADAPPRAVISIKCPENPSEDVVIVSP